MRSRDHVGEMKALDQLDQFFHHALLAAGEPPPVAAGALPLGDRDAEGLERREIGEQLIDLERARDAEPHALVRLQVRNVAPVEPDAAGARPQYAGQEIDERGLAGAVRADQRVARAALDLQRDVARGGDAAEALVEMFGVEHGRHRAFA